MAVKKRVQTAQEDKLILNISLDMSNILVEYSLSYAPSQNNLANMKKLLESINIETYRYNYDIYNNLVLCRAILDSRLTKSISRPELIKETILAADPSLEDVCSAKTWKNNLVVGQDARAITQYIDKKMKFYCFYVEMPKIIELWEKCTKSGFEMSDDELFEVDDRMSKLVVKMQNSSIATGLLSRFSFSDPNAADLIESVAQSAQRPAAILQTGIRQLNANLGPGFRGGKMYCFIGFSGKFKSGTLLNLADQITKFNPQLEEIVEGKRNTVLFITAENTINETLERLFYMYATPGASFIDTDPAEVRRIIMEEGHYCFSDTDKGIDIEMRYFPNLGIKTSDIYKIIDDMDAHGQRVITTIVDYIKRIDSVFPSNGDEILRMTYVAKELKTLAEYYNIPVITAQQINRNGNSVLDSAMREGKSDLLRAVGNSDIGGAWAVVEECDWVCIITLERHKKENRLYLSFKCTKQRCGHKDSTVSDYFNHPFANEQEIRLMTDLDKEGSMSVLSLASDLESVDVSALEEYNQKRPKDIVSVSGTNGILETLGIKAKCA